MKLHDSPANLAMGPPIGTMFFGVMAVTARAACGSLNVELLGGQRNEIIERAHEDSYRT
jgi:hypothetical protein